MIWFGSYWRRAANLRLKLPGVARPSLKRSNVRKACGFGAANLPSWDLVLSISSRPFAEEVFGTGIQADGAGDLKLFHRIKSIFTAPGCDVDTHFVWYKISVSLLLHQLRDDKRIRTLPSETCWLNDHVACATSSDLCRDNRQVYLHHASRGRLGTSEAKSYIACSMTSVACVAV